MRSSWGNLGLWEGGSQSYSEACRALALRLAQRARLVPGCSVLDIGFGHGDQLLLWKQQFGVGRVTGIEADAACVAEARRKLEATSYTDVSLYLDATKPDLSHARYERYDFYDRALALDCAYHFAPRSEFFAHAVRTLQPGGVLALTDIVVADGVAVEELDRIAGMCGIPAENLLTQQAYEKALLDLGFCKVQFENLDDAVLGGFRRFALRLLLRPWIEVPRVGRLKVLATAAIMTWLSRKQRVHYLLISAERPDILVATANPEVTALSSSGTPADA
jgi:SAM-dependent methyltransferase